MADASVRLSKSDQRLYERAYTAADRGRWTTAHSTASKAREKLPAKVLRWMHMTRCDRNHRFEDIAGFMADNPGWPGIKTLQRNAERAIGAYNAGPGAAKRLFRQNGDPRDVDVDVIDWVESIPYRETRNYVQRVMENIQVYRVRLGESEFAEGIVRDFKR